MKSKYILLLSFIFFIILQFLFSLGTAPLSDDIGHYVDVIKLKNGEISSYDVYKDLFNDPNRYTRPLSPIVFGTLIVTSSFGNNVFFLWGILYLLHTFILYKVINHYFDNQWLAVLSCILVLLFPLSSSNLYSPVMQSVQVVIGFFLWSVLLCKKEELIYCCLIGILSLASLLFYELNLFLLPILGLILITHKKQRGLKIFLAIILPIILAFFYKLFFVKLIYPDYFNYSSSKILLDFDKIKDTPIALIKLFTTDTLYIIIKSFKAIYFYSLWDFLLLIIGTILSILASLFIRPTRLITKTELGALILFFLLTIVVFFISNYPPVAFGFENRILLWVRISSALLFATLLNNLLFFTESKKYLNSAVKFGISLIIFSGIVTVISQKNSWISAAKYNENIVKNLTKVFPNHQENIRILYLMDHNKKKNLITDEGTLNADYKIYAALKLYTPQVKFNPNNIIITNPTNYSLYQIGNIQFNKRPASEYIPNDKEVIIGKISLNYPFYIYDERDNSVYIVNSKKDFKIK